MGKKSWRITLTVLRGLAVASAFAILCAALLFLRFGDADGGDSTGIRSSSIAIGFGHGDAAGMEQVDGRDSDQREAMPLVPETFYEERRQTLEVSVRIPDEAGIDVSTPTPTIAPTPYAPEPTAMPEPLATVEAMITNTFGLAAIDAIAIATCESKLTASEIGGPNFNGSYDYGLFQLNEIHAAKWPEFWEMWADPYWNTAKAYELWVDQGWRPWSACIW